MIPKLLFDISNCSEFCKLIKNRNIDSKCREIVDSQINQEPLLDNDFQIPEPWTGDIVNAPILIISSNPGYSGIELYPNSTWPNSMVADFFINRFQDRGSKYSWVYNNKVLNNDGTRGIPVRYWTSINKRVEELLLKPVKPGIDYCITEIVHCKSLSEKGVNKSLPMCSSLFIENKLRISGAKLIIGIGEFVSKHFDRKDNINGIPITYLPHPNAFKPKTFQKTQTKENLDKIRNILKINSLPEQNIEYSTTRLPNFKEIEKFIELQTSTNNTM